MSGLWPAGKRACVCVTMDNMGEAADLHRGIWPADAPVGIHFSVTESLPRMLDLLDEFSMPATYFVEAWNCQVYPDTLKNLRDRGLEIGFHALQHEVWAKLDAATEIHNLDEGVARAGAIGVVYKGFRPPGGRLTGQTLNLIKAKGMTHVSPAGSGAAIDNGVAFLPFEWKFIDAYAYMDSTAKLRLANGDSTDAFSPEAFQKSLLARLDEVLQQGGFLSLLFHPFLTNTAERLDVMRNVLTYLRDRKDDIWLARHHEVADWVLSHPQAFASPPQLDDTDWKSK